jgi:outer membrane protein OmpA-like peptidoglycan-associated protein
MAPRRPSRFPSAPLALLLALTACGYTAPPSPSHPSDAPPPAASGLAVAPAPSASALAVTPAAPDPVRRTPPADSDGDGVPDLDDACPCQPGDASPNPKESGCPYDAPPRAHRHAQPLEIHATIEFSRGAVLSTDAERKLVELARIIQENPQIREVQVTGHAAAPGGRKALARRRAEAVIGWLSGKQGGVDRRLLVLLAAPSGEPPTGSETDRVDILLRE